MKFNWKKVTALFCTVCVLGTMAAGCGSRPADSESVKTDETSPAEGAQQEPADSAGNGAVAPEETPEAQEGKWHVLEPEIAAIVDADFSGTVWKLGEDSFYIVEEKVMLDEDGGIISSSPSGNADIPDSDLVEVVFDENTYFYLRTIHGNGESHEDTDAGLSDLEKGSSVEMKGSFEQDIFHADEIRIVKVS